MDIRYAIFYIIFLVGIIIAAIGFSMMLIQIPKIDIIDPLIFDYKTGSVTYKGDICIYPCNIYTSSGKVAEIDKDGILIMFDKEK